MRARRLHPDLGGADPSAMSELNEAYRTLRSGRRAPGPPPNPDDVDVGTAVEDDVEMMSSVELGPSSVRLRRFIIATVVLLGLAMLMVYLAAAGYWGARHG